MHFTCGFMYRFAVTVVKHKRLQLLFLKGKKAKLEWNGQSQNLFCKLRNKRR